MEENILIFEIKALHCTMLFKEAHDLGIIDDEQFSNYVVNTLNVMVPEVPKNPMQQGAEEH